jgi:hypothetical protein
MAADPTLRGSGHPSAAGPLDRLLASRWLWCLAASVFLTLKALGAPPNVLTTFGDTDDATRLIQIREFLAGAGWYDTLLPRFGGTEPLVSHWSRLIDLPIAGLILAFSLGLAMPEAELAARIVWPALLTAGFLRLLVHEAERRGGQTAGWIVLVLAATCATGLFQFVPGRIDHHNVMIIATVGGLLLAMRAIEQPHLAIGAGALLGFGLVIGYEPLGLVVPVLGFAVLVGVLALPLLGVVRDLATAMALVLAIGLMLTVKPGLWHLAACDALSVNLVLFTAVGALGLWLLDQLARAWRWHGRLGLAVVAGAMAVTAYAAVDTTCLAGPFAGLSEDARRLWLERVTETFPLRRTAEANPLAGILAGTTLLLGLVAALVRWRSVRSPEAAALVLLMLAVIPVALWQVKFVPHASFIATFAIGLWVATWTGGDRTTPLTARLVGILLFSQASLGLVAGAALLAGGADRNLVEKPHGSSADVCMTYAAMTKLRQLPPGLIVANVDLGPAIVALTPHDAYAAPYHRIHRAIVETQRVFAAPAAAAEGMLTRLGASYVVECLPPVQAGAKPLLPDDMPAGSLYATLAAGVGVPFLEAVPDISSEPALRVWRVLTR